LHNIQELKEEHIVLMTQTLESNESIRKLSLLKAHPPLPKDDDDKNAGENNGKVKKELPAVVVEESLSTEASAVAMANMLRVNTSLEELALSAVDFNEFAAMFVAKALEEDNKTLQHLWLLAPTNYGGTSSFPADDPRIDYFLRLNRAGREKVSTLLTLDRCGDADDNASRQAWVESLLNAKRDIDCSFFFLSTRPSLCQSY
jgi:hypothetical protein